VQDETMDTLGPAARRPYQRRDATENRARLIDASREVFATYGPDAPLEEIARTAGVSRTTLHRNFRSREELVAAVYESNLLAHEADALELAGLPGGIVTYFDSVLLSLSRNLGITRVVLSNSGDWHGALSDRMRATFEPLLKEGIRDGVVRPGVGIDDINAALHMADCALADDLARGVPERFDMIAGILRTGLFLPIS
jgi:AcrR family transcriptional regulator